VHCGVDRRVSAHEEQFEPFIRELSCHDSFHGIFLEKLHRWLAGLNDALMADDVN
jgi:hypothetical protein